jgi:hypothetical protein
MRVSLEWFMSNLEDLKYTSEMYEELRDAYEAAYALLQAEVLRLDKLDRDINNG